MASFRIKYSMFWAISEPYLLPRTFWAWKKAHFLSILLILNLYSVALCCLNVDLPPPCHKHTSKLSIALSPMSIELLDRFLDQKTWFFVFSKSYARFDTPCHKGIVFEKKPRPWLVFGGFTVGLSYFQKTKESSWQGCKKKKMKSTQCWRKWHQ